MPAQRAYRVSGAVTGREPNANGFSNLLLSVYHQIKVLFSFVGSAGLFRVLPFITVCSATALPPLLSNVTLYSTFLIKRIVLVPKVSVTVSCL